MNVKANSDPKTRTITPYFTVTDADALIRFLTDAFDATLVKEDRYADGRIQHARLMIGNSLIMLNQSTEQYPANQSQMYIRVDDADAAFQTALALGAVAVMEPNDRPFGDRMAGIQDPCGNVWWLASGGV